MPRTTLCATTDRDGLKTYKCKRTLKALGGSGQRSGPDISGNPFFHEFLCTVDTSGKQYCVGFTSANGGLFGPGALDYEDEYSSEQCDEARDDDSCVESCIARRTNGSQSLPQYAIDGGGRGWNRQQYVDYACDACVAECTGAPIPTDKWHYGDARTSMKW